MAYSYLKEIEDIQSGRTNNGELQDSAIGSTVNDILSNTEKNGVNQTNVLKYYNMISASDFDKYLISKQQETLKQKSLKETEQNVKDKESEKFYNLSIKNVGENTSKVLIDVMNDLVKFVNDEHKTFGKLFNIFTKNDRMIYVGIVIVLLSIMFYFITVTS